MPRCESLEKENKISLTDIEKRKMTGICIVSSNSKKSRQGARDYFRWRDGAWSYIKMTGNFWISWVLIPLNGSGNNINDDSSALVVYEKTRAPKWCNNLFWLLACFMLNMCNCVLCFVSLCKRLHCYLTRKRRSLNCFYNAVTVLCIHDHSSSMCVTGTQDSSLLFPRGLPSKEPN